MLTMTTSPFGLGANESVKDYRTLTHDQVGIVQLKVAGGSKYPAVAIMHQHKLGICTAISLVQQAQVVTGKKYSVDYQYLMQKLLDGNWVEGSSPFTAVRAGKAGLLPVEHMPNMLDGNPNMTYPEYIAKLQKLAANPAKMAALKALCEYPIQGYGQVNVADDALLAQAIADSKAGIIARFAIGDEWWTDASGTITWAKEALQPLRPVKAVVSGHQTSITDYDFSTGQRMARTANTWSADWCDEGSALFNLKTVRPTEGWVLYYDEAPEYVALPDPATWSHTFVVPMRLGDSSENVKALQVKLMMLGHLERVKQTEWGVYGPKTAAAVLKFQVAAGVQLTYFERFVLRGTVVGAKTLRALNTK